MPSPDLLGDDVTVPAGGLGPGIIMAPVAELPLVAVAFQAGPGQACIIDLPVRGPVGTVSLPDDAVTPSREEFHVI